MVNNNITWKELKVLSDLYSKRQSSAATGSSPYLQYLINDKGLLDYKLGSNKAILPAEGFDSFFEKHYKNLYVSAKAFLEEHGIETSARKNFTVGDITTLMLVQGNKEELSAKLTSIEDFSSKIFESSKYLKSKSSVRDAVFKILGVSSFSLEAKEHQWRLVVDHPNPLAVVFCENKSLLKQPWIARELQIKLWYVGGNNIRIVDDIDGSEFARPLYYICDWDLAGLQIYLRIKRKLALRGKEIRLLYPDTGHKKIPENVEHHNTRWTGTEFSGLDAVQFTARESDLISFLITNGMWIEEESMNLIDIFKEMDM